MLIKIKFLLALLNCKNYFWKQLNSNANSYTMQNKLILFIVAILFLSCRKDNYDNITTDTTLRPIVALPLVNSTLEIKDLISALESDYIKSDDNGQLVLVFSDTLVDLKLEDLMEIPNQTQNYSVNLEAISIPNQSIAGGISLNDASDNFEPGIKTLIKNSNNTSIVISAPSGVMDIGSFTTTDDTPLANYLFNNTYANINSQSPFSSTNTTFVNDRNNQPTNAISVGSTSIPIAATIPNIPLGNSIRSVSFWFKKPAHSVAVGLFAYGANANQQTFGLYLGAGGNFVFQTFGNDHDFGGTSNANTWIHAILTYNGASAKLYVNGILIGQSINFTLNTQNTAFKIGGNGAIVEFDDLKIFNYELTQAQVTSLFNNNTLSSSDFNQDNLKVVLYPNPVRDILNIETELEIQSIEIYNIQGQKVLSSNQKQINVSDLAVGMYMVRIQDVANNIAIKKIVIK